MQCVVSGRLRGRKLKALPAAVRGVRPSSSRVRSAIFDRMQGEIEGARVLDLFAGSGALAVEAISRGAHSAVCVDVQREVVAFLRQQFAALELASRVEVRLADAIAFVSESCSRELAFDLVLVDPPYDQPDLIGRAVDALVTHGRLRPGALVVCERERRRSGAAMVWPRSLRSEAHKEHGDTVLEFLRCAGDPTSGGPRT